MTTLMRNGRDRRSENPFLGHAKKERVSLFGTDQRITSGPAAKRPHSKAEYMTAPERFAESQILFPCTAGLSQSGVGHRSCDRPHNDLGSSPCRGPALTSARLMFDAPL